MIISPFREIVCELKVDSWRMLQVFDFVLTNGFELKILLAVIILDFKK